MLAYGVPDRMATALHAVFMREGMARHAGKIGVIDELLCDENRIPLTAPEGAIFTAAERAARECYAIISRHPITANPLAIQLQISAVCERLGVLYPLGETDAESWARATDYGWWVRALRKEFSRRFEHAAIRLGLVGRDVDPYISRESAVRQAVRNAQNAKLLATVTLSNGAQEFTLAELAAKGTSNKALRRGELMTRIKGFEEIATDMGHVGLFFTITNPSKYHSVGGTNPKYNGATPRDGQAQLCRVWARARAAFKRAGIMPYGFRIAEPHLDGCPHWHMLLFVHPDQAAEMERIVRLYALQEDGDEDGAEENRVDLVRIETDGGRSAVGYIIKYVAKNIDGHGVGDHHATEGGETYVVAPDLLGDMEITASDRVTYWAQTWGIRQFQQIGGAPVTVWRELRRVKKDAITGAAPEMQAAWDAVQKVPTGEISADGKPVMRQASWRDYLKAQGGAAPGRDYAIRIESFTVQIEGKYAVREVKKPVGVYAVSAPALIHVSTRYVWEVVDTPKAGALPTRTCVNNCTGTDAQLAALKEMGTRFSVPKASEWTGRELLRHDPLVSWTDIEEKNRALDKETKEFAGKLRAPMVNGHLRAPGDMPKELENKIFSAPDLVAEWKAGRAEDA